ncbi:PREDICTED: ras GTPase-activating protein-binding protein 2-like [Acropora digitifera]|uniref:ras GTPase-activating protein-binding protein 2-like n=1 Tax=Acropora digitifera TaxID=70779 RepID=UPI00077A27D9|nr:PREDICTED: ras GTPase-activating protein-binding protein 2-like [Acropora digitifera]
MFSCLQMHPHEAIAETAVVHPQGDDDFITAPSNGQIEENLYEGENEGQELEGAESDTNGNLDDTIDEPIEPEKPKTWAALAASRAPTAQKTTTPVSSTRPVRQSPQAPAQSVIPPPPRPQAAPVRPSKEARGSTGNREPRVTARNAPDNHQVFIGNLPNGVKEDEVRSVFAKYGTILEIRLNPKNFGFVIFNSPEPVEQILDNRPIHIGNHEINIEQKKPSGSVGRGGGGNRRGGGNAGGVARGNARGGGGQPGRGGSSGTRASNRGGFGGNSKVGSESAGSGSSGRTGGRRDSGGRGGKFK